MQLSKRATALTIGLQLMLTISMGVAIAGDEHKGFPKESVGGMTEGGRYDQSNMKDTHGFRPQKLYGPGMEKNDLYNSKDPKGFRPQKLYGPGKEKKDHYNSKDNKGFRPQKQ